MSLDLQKLEKVRELANGVTQARCPACAEGGGDQKGEHLRIYADGRYGCCVHPKDGEHRKRIFALAGDRRQSAQRGQFKVRLATSTKAAKPANSVREALAGEVRPTRPDESDPKAVGNDVKQTVRTLRTPFSNPHAYEREESTHICKDWENGVLSVLKSTGPVGEGHKLPFFVPQGAVFVPLDSPERYHWWKEGGERLTREQIVEELLDRLEAPGQEEIESSY